ncbi:MAG: hypothetical protein Q7T44_04355 [Parvibaculum sp.]|nr:hypothetical protein [Parvibaculum sp.]
MLDLIDPRADHAETLSVEEAWAMEIQTQAQITRFKGAMWIAVAVLLLFNSAALVTVVNGFGVGPVQDTIVVMADTWNTQMEKQGLSEPVRVIREGVLYLHDLDWSDVGLGDAPDQGAHNLRGSASDGSEG